MPLPPAAASVWAKSDRRSDGWLPLYRHMADAGAVAGLLWDHWVPDAVRRLIAEGTGLSDPRTVVVWLTAVHDLGKATPAFAVQVEALAGRMRAAGLPMPEVLPDRRTLPHSTASYLALRGWLEGLGVPRKVALGYAAVVGGHHGVPPATVSHGLDDRADLFGTGPWTGARTALAEHAARVAGLDDPAAVLTRPPDVRAQVLLTAVVVVADWLASDADRFPYGDPTPSPERARRAWHDLDLPGAWRPTLRTTAPDELFAARFTLPTGASVRPVQAAVVEAAASLDSPGLIIVEAPMGEGKTEAALAAAEVLAARFGCGGLLVALPTMATSDAMYSRVHRWMRRLPLDGSTSLYLAHGRAAFNPEVQRIARLGPVRCVDADGTGHEAEIVVRSWLSGRKKGLLSAFVVGTVDQLLFAALQARHVVLRHLALAGKVVVVDEAHAADVYMAQYLCRALYWLGAYRVPVIVLSATLPPARRIELATAYRDGRRFAQPPAAAPGPRWRQSSRPADPLAVELAGDLGYPVVTTVGDTATVSACEPSGRAVDVAVEELPDTDDALLAVVDRALAGDGGVVMVVRDTVARAQRTADVLRRHLGEEPDRAVPGGSGVVRLVHSRFVATDRQRIETGLRDVLGPDGDRPRRLVLVGTQVLEQSLDIDVDLLVTDLAPIDLLLQRIGRLHRHARPRPPHLRHARCLVTGIAPPADDAPDGPPVPDAGCTAVYGAAALLDTLVVLRDHLAATGGVLALPRDVAPLVRAGYGGEVRTPSGWEDVLDAAREQARQEAAARRSNAATFLLPAPRAGDDVIGWLDARSGEPDDSRGAQAATAQCAVRDGEDSLEVLVGRRVGDELRLLPWLERYGDAVLPPDAEPEPGPARALATCALRLPASLTRYPPRFDAVLTALEARGRSAWQSSHWLQGELVLWLDEDLTAELAGCRLRYSPADGLVVTWPGKEHHG